MDEAEYCLIVGVGSSWFSPARQLQAASQLAGRRVPVHAAAEVRISSCSPYLHRPLAQDSKDHGKEATLASVEHCSK